MIMHWFCLASSILAKARFAIAKRCLERQATGVPGPGPAGAPKPPRGWAGGHLCLAEQPILPHPTLGKCSPQGSPPRSEPQWPPAHSGLWPGSGRGCRAPHRHPPPTAEGQPGTCQAQTGTQETPGRPPPPALKTLTGNSRPGPALCTAAPAPARRSQTSGTGSPTPGCCRCTSAGQTVASGTVCVPPSPTPGSRDPCLMGTDVWLPGPGVCTLGPQTAWWVVRIGCGVSGTEPG